MATVSRVREAVAVLAGDIDRALEEVKKERPYGYTMKEEVAKAAEATRPPAAMEIYRKEAEQHIPYRNRESYHMACRYLKKVRDLSRQVADEARWKSYVARLREKHRALRALADEMNKAGR
jgi:uncharacterized Zn finger protein